MKRTLIAHLVLFGILTLTAVAQRSTQNSNAAEALLGAAIHQEEAEQNLEAAIASYKKVLSQYGNNRPLAARAQYRLGLAYEKLGNPEARNAFERVVRNYSDQEQVASDARRRLAALAGSSTSDKLVARQLLSGSSVNGAYDISPDGRRMVRTDWARTGDLIVHNLSTGQEQRLMAKTQTLQESAEFAENPIFSPGDRQIAFAWFDGDKYQLRIMPNQPGAKPRILVNNTDFSYAAPAGWSRDGTSVLATFWKRDKTALLAWVALKDGSMSTLKSLEWRQPGYASVSPDGRYIAYSARERSDVADIRQVYILAADGSHETLLVSGAAVNEDPLWTPDGNHVLFLSDRSGSLGLWAISVRAGKASSDPFLVKPDIGTQAYRIGITRDGSYYFMTRRGGDDVFVADVAPDSGHIRGTPYRLTEKFLGANRSPSWSPDGKSIAFKRSGTGTFDVVIHSLETGQEKSYTIPFRTRQAPRPLWFPDSGSVLVDIVDNQGRNGYYRLDLGSGKFTEAVTPAPGLVQWAALSPDGNTVYAVKNGQTDRGIVAFDLVTRREKSVFSGALGVTSIALSPDGRTLAMRKGVRNGAPSAEVIALVEVDGSRYREVQTGGPIVPGATGVVAWTKDGHSILYGVGDDTAQVRLMQVPIDGGKPEFTGLTIERGSPQSAMNHYVDFSPDGSRLVFGSGDGPIKEIWVLENILPALTSRSR